MSDSCPVYYNGKRSRGKRYLEMDVKPRYPFGFGLSYTSFQYDNLFVTPQNITPDEEATVTVDITNTGAVAGAETVQLYIYDTRELRNQIRQRAEGLSQSNAHAGRNPDGYIHACKRAFAAH